MLRQHVRDACPSLKRTKRLLLTKAVYSGCVIMGILKKINWHLLLLWTPVFSTVIFTYFSKGPTCAEDYILVPGDPHFEIFRLLSNYTLLLIPLGVYLCVFKSFSSSNLFSQILILMTCGFYFVMFLNALLFFYSSDFYVSELFTYSEENIDCTDEMR